MDAITPTSQLPHDTDLVAPRAARLFGVQTPRPAISAIPDDMAISLEHGTRPGTARIVIEVERLELARMGVERVLQKIIQHSDDTRERLERENRHREIEASVHARRKRLSAAGRVLSHQLRQIPKPHGKASAQRWYARVTARIVEEVAAQFDLEPDAALLGLTQHRRKLRGRAKRRRDRRICRQYDEGTLVTEIARREKLTRETIHRIVACGSAWPPRARRPGRTENGRRRDTRDDLRDLSGEQPVRDRPVAPLR